MVVGPRNGVGGANLGLHGSNMESSPGSNAESDVTVDGADAHPAPSETPKKVAVVGATGKKTTKTIDEMTKAIVTKIGGPAKGKNKASPKPSAKKKSGKSSVKKKSGKSSVKKESDKAVTSKPAKASGKSLKNWDSTQEIYVETTHANKPKSFPFRNGSFTVFNDAKTSNWRIKAYPGSRHTFKIAHSRNWTAVVEKICNLVKENK